MKKRKEARLKVLETLGFLATNMANECHQAQASSKKIMRNFLINIKKIKKKGVAKCKFYP